MNTWQEAVVQIVLILIGLAFTYMGNTLVKNKKAATLIQVLTPLAKAAVIAAQKLGIDKDLTGAMQKNEAVQAVISGLAHAGFTKVDQTTIENAVEAAYASLKDTLDNVYDDASKDDVGKTDTTAVEVPVAKVDTSTEASGSVDTTKK